MAHYVGVDGCSGGWFTVEYDAATRTVGTHALYERFAEVVEAYADAECLLVDMPIGLPETGRRQCDEAAKRLLGSRAPTVFFTPCRAVLEASEHTDASAVNREHTGNGLSIQAWNLVPRIREVDAVLRDTPGTQSWVAESHPELCFAALGGTPVEERKSTAEGRTTRLGILRESLPDAAGTYETCLDSYYRKDVARDDVLDAMVLAVSASRPRSRVPDVADDDVPRDACGLPMEIQLPTNELFINKTLE